MIYDSVIHIYNNNHGIENHLITELLNLKSKIMKTDIILAGVGGQGILSIAAALGSAALTNNLYMKQAETHGMSQRGGDVQSYMRISDKPIFSDLIAKGTADIILSVEPMEALRYLPYLKKGGYVVTNATPFINIPNYPEVETLMATLKALPHHVIIDADNIAKEAAGNVRTTTLTQSRSSANATYPKIRPVW